MTAYQPYSEAQIIGFLKPDVEKAKKMDNASHESQSARPSSSNAPRWRRGHSSRQRRVCRRINRQYL